MGKMKVLQSSLNGGEISPRLKGRPELPRYQSGLDWCENFLPLVLGGATVRPGTRMVTVALNSPEGNRLDCYTGLDDVGVYRGYCIESVATQIRAFKGYDVAGTASTPEGADFAPKQMAQYQDYLYMVQPGSGPLRLKKSADATWLQELVKFTAQPFMRPPNTEGIALTPSALTGNITISASAPFFQAGHVGLVLELAGGKVQISSVTDATHADGLVTTDIPAPQSTPESNTKVLVFVITYAPTPGSSNTPWTVICRATADFRTFTISATNEVTAGATGINVSVTDSNDGTYVKSKVFQISYTPPGGSPDSPWTITCTAKASIINVPVGDMTVKLKRFEAITDRPAEVPNTVSIETYDTASGLESGTDWKEQAWSDLRGWPVAVGFFEQRMLLAGGTTYPTTLWGSKSGDQLDFTLGTDDDAAFAFTIAAADTPIRSVKTTDKIYVFTATKEICVESGNDKPVTPTNFRIKPRTNMGASFMPAVLAGSDVIFASLSGNRLYSLLYRFEADRYVADDITIYGEHLVREAGGIEQVVVMREPVPVLWCRTKAETLITLTYDSSQQVAAWARVTTAGAVKQIVPVPATDGNDEIWAVIERENQTFIEAFDWSLNTDCAATGSDPNGKTQWLIASHLDGLDVVAVADGYVVQGLTVVNGKVTLPFAAKEVEIGLPFTARLKDLPPAVAGVASTISGQSSVNQIHVLLDQTKGATVNGERLPFQRFDGALLDQPVPAYSGWKKVGGLGWWDFGSGGQVEIVRDLPLPCTVLAIAKEVTVNG